MIILDSSFLIAYHNTRDVHHAAAARAMVRLAGGEWGEALLLEYVFLEVVTVLRARTGLKVAARVGTTLLQAREVEFVPCSDLFLETFSGFRQQVTGELSFVDAAIVAVARRNRPGFVATFDEDFRSQEGIKVIPA
ncbi:MAG: PIN domain-containing protein [Gemmatimonadaceae bacterium]|nr:PIN domain-containing protein [Gemmatimonadaceae bacterium]